MPRRTTTILFLGPLASKSADQALRISESLGLAVQTCDGPKTTYCPLAAGRNCEKLNSADGVVFSLPITSDDTHSKLFRKYKVAAEQRGFPLHQQNDGDDLSIFFKKLTGRVVEWRPHCSDWRTFDDNVQNYVCTCCRREYAVGQCERCADWRAFDHTYRLRPTYVCLRCGWVLRR